MQQLMLKAALRAAKDWMREHSSLTEEDLTSANQPELPLGILPGYRPPMALAVLVKDGEYEYVRYDCATWADLEGALIERTLNIERAIARKQDHVEKMYALRPYLQGYPERTVAEACELMRKDTS
jgi:hypothetical protein